MSKNSPVNTYKTNNYSSDKWQERIAQIAYRFNHQYQNQKFAVPRRNRSNANISGMD